MTDTAKPAGPFDWSFGGTIADASDLAAAITQVATGVRSGAGLVVRIQDRSHTPPLAQSYRVAAVKPVDAVMNARLRDVAAQILQFSGANVLQVKPEAARYLPLIDACFKELRAIVEDKPRIILPGGLG